jgi:Abortive infection alpha
MSEEIPKAIGEVAKATGKISDLLGQVGSFVGRIMGPAADQLGYSLEDRMRLYRYKNLVKIEDRVNKIHRARRIEGSSIPIAPRLAIPLLKAAADEDDDLLQEYWAGLVANWMDPAKGRNMRRQIIEVLSSLEPLDARILAYLADKKWLLYGNVPGGGITSMKIKQDLGVEKVDVHMALVNLERVACIFSEYPVILDDRMGTSIAQRLEDPKTIIRPSPLGFAVISSCNSESTDPIVRP